MLEICDIHKIYSKGTAQGDSRFAGCFFFPFRMACFMQSSEKAGVARRHCFIF